MRDLGLIGRVVLITGGGGALGRVIAQGFADLGARVAVNDRSPDLAEAAVAGLTGSPEVLAVPGDVSNDSTMAGIVARTAARFGSVDVLVTAAAVQLYPPRGIEAVEPGDWATVVDTSLTAAYLAARHVVPVMRRSGRGRIINIASIAGHRGAPGGGAYSAAKGGILMLTRQLAVELGPDQITVNSVSPGFTPTRLTSVADLRRAPGEQLVMPPSSLRPPTLPPLGRAGRAEDYVGPVLFLASDWASFITGVDIPVEGGAMAAR